MSILRRAVPLSDQQFGIAQQVAGRGAAIVASLITLAAIAAVTMPAQAAPLAAPVVCTTSQPSWAWQQAVSTPVISKANGFNTSGQQFCIKAPGTWQQPGPPWLQVVTNLRFTGNWQAYPYTGIGCAYGLCSKHTDLPKQVRRLPASANTSFSWQPGGAGGNWNASYDIWFDRSGQITTEDNGAELMIWLRPNPGYHGGQLVHIGRRWFWFMHWRVCDRARICWNYIQFRFTRTVYGVRQLWLRPFLRFAEARGLIQPWWWLTSLHAGYEIVSGGRGLTTTWFNAHI